MLFAIDVGNTNITMGLFDGEKLEDIPYDDGNIENFR